MAAVSRIRERARSTFWVVPAVCVVAAVGLAIGLVALDRAIGDREITYLFPGPPEGARSFLGAIISAMISFTALIFSITIVVLVLTSGQFSPRVLRRFLRDRAIQWSLGIFVATFVYAMTVVRAVLGTNNTGAFVPRIAVTAAFLLVLLSVGLFIYYIHHIAHMIRAASIITSIGEGTRALLERRCPVDAPPPPEPVTPQPDIVVPATRPGVVVSVNEVAIVARAAQEDRTIVLVPRVGDFVAEGAPLFQVSGGDPDRDWLHREVVLADERTMEQDVAFGFRQLVDIAERALSPSTNDPTTACQAIDVLHDLLRRLATRRLPTGRLSDGDGRVRLVVPQYDFADYLQVALVEIWFYGSDSAQVPERLATLLRDLQSVALPEHRPVVQLWAAVIEPVVARRRAGYPDLPGAAAMAE
ncbi:MAG: DUF2254 domain-containing protein [Pseudonocardiaceae bacterium]